ncbi:hypothetical protein DITRI_Ditri14bG0108000 [Diplodiscus trichospermus]
MGNAEPDWEYLPKPGLFIVLEKLDSPHNVVRFGAVSRHWHSVFNTFLDIKRCSNPNRVPMLLIPTKKSDTKRKLYSLQVKAKISSIELHQSNIRRFCGSCFGWLATVDENMAITLSNPFKDGVSIDLPQLEFSPKGKPAEYQYAIQKVVLSADPSLHPNSYVVVVIYSNYCNLAFYQSWEYTWIYLDKDVKLVTDIVFYKSLVYVIGHRNDAVSFDVNGSFAEGSRSPKLKTIVPKEVRLGSYSDRAYLVESSEGNLYSIHRELVELDIGKGDDNPFITGKFKVFKMVLDDKNGELIE